MVAIPEPLKSLLESYKKQQSYFSYIGISTSLTPENVMGLRGEKQFGFQEYYHPRPTDNLIKGEIENSKNVIVIGNPLAGKTRAIYHALISLKNSCQVIIPRVTDINILDIKPPKPVTFKNVIVLFDDIDKFSDKENFTNMLDEFRRMKAILIATCRFGKEWEKVCALLDRELPIFDEPILINPISKEKARKVAKEAGEKLPDRFDGNIGSIFIAINTMKQRFKELSEEQKGVLRSIRRLYLAGIFKGREIFSIERIKKVCKEKEEIEKKEFEWNELFGALKTSGFIEKKNDEVAVEETYLQQVIKADFNPLENFVELAGIFTGDAEALFKIGTRAWELGQVMKRKAVLMEIAINAYHLALKIYTPGTSPKQYAMTQNNLGNTYVVLAQVEDTAANCKLAIKTYKEALKVFTLADFPIQYSDIQNNLGDTYRVLAEVKGKAENKAENCRKAIEACKEALKVRTFEDFPMVYAGAQNNLGNAYRTLSEVEDKAANCKKAIKAYEEALKVYNLKDFPMGYAMTQNNLGNAYQTLARAENKAANCEEAIKAYVDALKVYTIADSPMDYAMTQNNLGLACKTLAEVENKATNCEKAEAAFMEALKVYTPEEFPEPFRMVAGNLKRLMDFCGE